MSETWLPVVGYEGLYSVSDLGRVRSEYRIKTIKGRWGYTTRSWPEKIMRTSTDPAGYPSVSLSKDSKTTAYRVHTLLLNAFRGPRPEGNCARHLDDNKTNNTLENLVWGSHLDNSRDKYRNGNGNQYVNRSHCKNGHELNPENIYPNRAARVCKICSRTRAAKHYQSKKKTL